MFSFRCTQIEGKKLQLFLKVKFYRTGLFLKNWGGRWFDIAFWMHEILNERGKKTLNVFEGQNYRAGMFLKDWGGRERDGLLLRFGNP